MKDNNDLVLRVIKDSLFYLPEKLFSIFYGFAALLIYTRILTPEEYGDFSLITITIGIFGIFAYAWLNFSNLRFFSLYKKDNKLEVYFSTSFFILISALAFSSMVIYILSNFSLFPLGIMNFLLLIICLLVSTSFFESIKTILRADRQSKAYSFFSITASILYITNSLLLIYILNLKISAIMLSLILTNSILSILIILKYDFQKYINLKYVSRDVSKQFFNYGMPLIATLLFSWILALSDRYFIEYFRNAQEVGIYSATYQLANYPISLVSSLIYMASIPIVIDVWERQGDEITKDLISKIVRYYLILSIPILFGLMILSPSLMYILGDKYIGGLIIVPWIAIGSFAVGLNIYTDVALELNKKTKIVSYMMFIASIGNIILNFIFIPKFGFFGAGLSTAFSYILYLGLSWFKSRNYMQWKFPTKTMINCIIASLFMSGTILILKLFIQMSVLNVFIMSAIGCMVYLIIIYLIKEIDDEIYFIKNYLNGDKSDDKLYARIVKTR